MVFEELHSRYGSHVARRVQQELTPTEFNEIALADLPHWLETRAETAHRDYQTQLDNPFLNDNHDEQVNALYRRWQGAEDLSYIITIAEDVGMRGQKAVEK